MQWYKAISPEHPAFDDLMNELGYEGYGKFMAVLAHCNELGTVEITDRIIMSSIKTNRRSLPKLLQLFTQTLDKLLENFGESLVKVSVKFGESLPKLEGQNPRGSNARKERSEEIEKKETKQQPCRRTKCSDEQMQLAKWIFEQIKQLNPSAKEPSFDQWGNSIRLMVEQDKRSLDAIKEVFFWANRHHFWKTNILSPDKLREKYDQLVSKMNSDTATPTTETKAQSLMAAQRLRDVVSGDVYEIERLNYNDTPEGFVVDGSEFIPIGRLEVMR